MKKKRFAAGAILPQAVLFVILRLCDLKLAGEGYIILLQREERTTGDTMSYPCDCQKILVLHIGVAFFGRHSREKQLWI